MRWEQVDHRVGFCEHAGAYGWVQEGRERPYGVLELSLASFGRCTLTVHSFRSSFHTEH